MGFCDYPYNMFQDPTFDITATNTSLSSQHGNITVMQYFGNNFDQTYHILSIYKEFPTHCFPQKYCLLLMWNRKNSPVTGEFLAQRPVTRSFDASLLCSWINGRINNGEAGDLRHYCAYYDVTVMVTKIGETVNMEGGESFCVSTPYQGKTTLCLSN